MELDYNYGRLNKITNGWEVNKNYSVVLGGVYVGFITLLKNSI